MKREKHIEQLENKMDNLDKKVNDIKIYVSQNDTKANRVFEDELMSISSIKTDISEKLKNLNENDELLLNQIAELIKEYEQKQKSLHKKYTN